jgi:hypothetical protein
VEWDAERQCWRIQVRRLKNSKPIFVPLLIEAKYALEALTGSGIPSLPACLPAVPASSRSPASSATRSRIESVPLNDVLLTWERPIMRFFLDHGADAVTGKPFGIAFQTKVQNSLRIFVDFAG